MGSTRPTIEVDNLDVDLRPWPKGPNHDYDNGSRYCFRVGKIEYVLWKWPWPEWIGLPTRETLKEWGYLIDGWRRVNTGMINHAHVDTCIRSLLHYL